ncbi:MAG: hypothetical protein LKE53_07885 [Oscillospiraceae bacterium]|nr:hypothetical protein [Oscillospiraceae bacterium]MDD3260910.1 hypothetical protein [Oscillospiraceae bacterium]
MFQSTGKLLRGITLGVVVGAAATLLTEKAMDNNRQLRRSARRAAHAVTGLMDDMGHAVSAKM